MGGFVKELLFFGVGCVDSDITESAVKLHQGKHRVGVKGCLPARRFPAAFLGSAPKMLVQYFPHGGAESAEDFSFCPNGIWFGQNAAHLFDIL